MGNHDHLLRVDPVARPPGPVGHNAANKRGKQEQANIQHGKANSEPGTRRSTRIVANIHEFQKEIQFKQR
jgi:hypothetical protein